MTNRVQNLRSSVSGVRPPVGSRQIGELYVNFADNQIGLINPAQAPVDLIGVRYFSSTANYAAGDFVVYNGQLYRANSAASAAAFNPALWTQVGGSVSTASTPPPTPQSGQLWFDPVSAQLYVYYDDGTTKQWVIAINQAGAYLSSTGGTLTGALGGPGANSSIQAVGSPPAGDNSLLIPTTSWVQSTLNGRQNRNRIINSNFAIDQRQRSLSFVTDGLFVCDRWLGNTSQTGKIQVITSANRDAGHNDVPAAAFINFGVINSYNPLATDYFAFFQRIEWINVLDLQWGSALAKPVTLSFWATATYGGLYSGAISNNIGTRSYPFSFTLASYPVWTFVSVTIPGDTSSTWNVPNDVVGMVVRFDLGSGANYRAPTGVWVSRDCTGATGTIQLITQSTAGINITNVQLEAGTQATPYDFHTFGEELALCQRYYQWGNTLFGGYDDVGVAIYTTAYFKVSMRVPPSVGLTAAYGFGNMSGAAVNNSTTEGVQFMSIITVHPGGGLTSVDWIADAEL